jgi:hypothetical protein
MVEDSEVSLFINNLLYAGCRDDRSIGRDVKGRETATPLSLGLIGPRKPSPDELREHLSQSPTGGT